MGSDSTLDHHYTEANSVVTDGSIGRTMDAFESNFRFSVLSFCLSAFIVPRIGCSI